MENSPILSNQLEEDLSLLGMDSIIFISVVIALEEEFDIEIPDEKLSLNEMNTIAKIMDVISSIG
jgi:phosphopantetheine attachment domain protein